MGIEFKIGNQVAVAGPNQTCKNILGIEIGPTFPIKTDFAFLKLAPSFSYSGASFLQCPHL